MRLSPDEMEDLIVKIVDQKLIVDGTEEVKGGKGWRQFTISTPFLEPMKADRIKVCHLPKDTLVLLIPTGLQSMSCPKSKISSESFTSFQVNILKSCLTEQVPKMYKCVRD